MTRLEIAGKDTGSLSFAPQTELEEIIQNVRTILTTRKGSVPLDREFGIDMSIVDKPSTSVQGLLTVEVMETVEKYEPRVKVQGVAFSGDGAEGAVYPIAKVVII